MSKITKLIILTIICATTAVTGSIFIIRSIRKWNANVEKPVVCTMEAKLCPDGSYVGRTGPQCSFATCPGSTDDWRTFSDASQSISFKYPERLVTTYVRTVDWPPKVAVNNEPFSCVQAGSEIMPAGKTEEQTINGKKYCVTRKNQGAAGSIYSLYVYTSEVNGKLAILTFSLMFPQCYNYDQPRQDLCFGEQKTFNIDGIIDAIFQTLDFSSSSQAKSGISGLVFLGPTCPVEKNPPDPQCADKPYQTNLELLSAKSRELIDRFSSGSDGKFVIVVPPGEYIIQSSSVVNFYPRCSNRGTITVAPESFTDTTVYCDTGIR